MKLLFYGRLADKIGREIDLDAAAGCTIAELRRKVIADHQHAQEVLDNRRVRACVAEALVDDDYVVTASDTVEFLPPVSGG